MSVSIPGEDHGWFRSVEWGGPRPACVRWVPPAGRGYCEVYATRAGVSVVGSHHLDTPDRLESFHAILKLATETHRRMAGGTEPTELTF